VNLSEIVSRLSGRRRCANGRAMMEHRRGIQSRWVGYFSCVHCGHRQRATIVQPNGETMRSCEECGDRNVVVFLDGAVTGAYCCEKVTLEAIRVGRGTA
jgi:hypothetical protein